MDKESLTEFIKSEKNGLRQSKEEGEYHLAVMFRPAGFIALQQLRRKSKKEYDSLLPLYNRFLYFTLEIAWEGKDLETKFGSNLSSFSDNIDFLNSVFPEHIKLVTSNDTIQVADYAYVRSYGIGPSRFLLVFQKPREREITIQVSGYELGFGNLSFSFDQERIQKTPVLNPGLL